MASFTDLLRHLPEGYNPKVIIMACDWYLFDPVSTKANIQQNMLQDFTPWQIDYLTTLRDILTVIPNHPWLLLAGLPQSDHRQFIGLGAYTMRMGFRKDGSTHCGYRESGPDNPKMAEMNPWRGFQDDPRRLCWARRRSAQFEQFVSEARARGIAIALAFNCPCTRPLWK